MTDGFDDSKDGSHVQRARRISFGMVDPDIIRDESLPKNVKTVYTYLVTYCSDVRSAYPSRSRIARQAGLSVRSVDGAIKTAEQVGLFTVQRRREGKLNQTNVYLLHDFGGGYEAGSGGLVQPLRQGVEQEMHQGGATAAPNLDNSSTPPPIKTTVTSGDAFAASGRRTSSQTDMKIMVGEDYWTMEAPRLMQYLTACLIKTLGRADLQLRPDGRRLIGKALRARVEAGATYQKILNDVQYWVTHEEEWSQLAYLPQSEAA